MSILTAASSEGCRLNSIGCEVLRMEYDWNSHTGTIHITEHQCVHMPGAIEFFRTVDANVRVIYTTAAGYEDTAYFRMEDGGWHALEARRPFEFLAHRRDAEWTEFLPDPRNALYRPKP